jgi:hypothetical protein
MTCWRPQIFRVAFVFVALCQCNCATKGNGEQLFAGRLLAHQADVKNRKALDLAPISPATANVEPARCLDEAVFHPRFWAKPPTHGDGNEGWLSSEAACFDLMAGLSHDNDPYMTNQVSRA